MTAPALLDSLKAHGVGIEALDGQLKLSAQPGVLKSRLIEMVHSMKPELLELLKQERESTYSSDSITSKSVKCIGCGVLCGEGAYCAFCVQAVKP